VVERLLANAWVALGAMRAQNRAMRRSPFAVILGVVQPVVFLAVSSTASTVSPEQSARLVIGVGLTALWGSTIWSAGSILRDDRAQGTLARSLTGLRSPSVVFLGKCLGATIRVTVIITVSTTVTAALLGFALPVQRPDLVLAGIVLVVLSGTGLGMLLSCLFLVTRHATAWSAALMYPVFIVSGMMIPLEYIPPGLRGVSAVISLRWAAEFLATSGAGTPVWSTFAALVLLTASYFVVALLAFRSFLHRARRDGTLDYG
jgi:ABC-2 type transport system permease protein